MADAPVCTICGKVAAQRDIDGDWWPPCSCWKTHGIESLRYLLAASPADLAPTEER